MALLGAGSAWSGEFSGGASKVPAQSSVPAKPGNRPDPKAESKAEARAEAGRTAVQKLTGEELRLSGKLEHLLSRMADLEAEVAERRGELAAVRSRQAAADRRRDQLAAERERSGQELHALLRAIWPAHLSRAGAGLAGVRSWAEADRRLVWLTAIYGAVGRKQSQIREQTRQMEENQARRDELLAQSVQSLGRVNAVKDGLLSEKLALLAGIKQVRARRMTAEEELREVLTAIQEMRYEKDEAGGEEGFALARGALPWPARGRVAETFDLQAQPPRRGLGLSLDRPGPVAAVFWGRVVHNDTLRGFGRVVILSHGQEYYSLYAFLAESPLAVGREVEKGEVLGTAGFYPKAQGPGVYFELRFHQKAINPEGWLARVQ